MKQLVAEFHRAFDCPINTVYPCNDALLLKLRYDLIAEEVKEFGEAADVGDAVGMLDALADISYVTFGAGFALACEVEDLLQPLRGCPALLVFPDAVQPHLQGYARVLRRRAAVIYSAIANGDVLGVELGLDSLLAEVVDTAEDLGLPLLYAFDLVHRSKMAKLTNGVVIKREDGKILKPEGWAAPDLKGLLEAMREDWLDAA